VDEGRRSLLLGLGFLPWADTWLRQARAAEGDVKFLEPEAAIVGRFVEQKDGWQRFETLDFQIDVPPGFDFIAAPQEQPLPGRGRGAMPSAVKANFRDQAGGSITVVEFLASQIKPTFFQLGDISQYGNAKDVAGLLTPPGVKLLSTRKDVLEQPERDTGTVRGKVKASPQTLYRYEYRLPTGYHVATAAAGRAGKVLLAGGFAKEAEWKAHPQELRRVINSFQLAFPN